MSAVLCCVPRTEEARAATRRAYTARREGESKDWKNGGPFSTPPSTAAAAAAMVLVANSRLAPAPLYRAALPRCDGAMDSLQAPTTRPSPAPLTVSASVPFPPSPLHTITAATATTFVAIHPSSLLSSSSSLPPSSLLPPRHRPLQRAGRRRTRLFWTTRTTRSRRPTPRPRPRPRSRARTPAPTPLAFATFCSSPSCSAPLWTAVLSTLRRVRRDL